jgi:hypothetical protein
VAEKTRAGAEREEPPAQPGGAFLRMPAARCVPRLEVPSPITARTGGQGGAQALHSAPADIPLEGVERAAKPTDRPDEGAGMWQK